MSPCRLGNLTSTKINPSQVIKNMAILSHGEWLTVSSPFNNLMCENKFIFALKKPRCFLSTPSPDEIPGY